MFKVEIATLKFAILYADAVAGLIREINTNISLKQYFLVSFHI